MLPPESVIIISEDFNVKSAKSAENYLSSIDDKTLSLQSIPTEPTLWKIENFQDFLVERRKILAKQLNQFLDSFSKTEKTTSAISIETLIDKGESDQLEFKSTFRWSLDKHQTDKILEGAILKTISAFTNSDGGTLLIGVSNNGDIVGLEHDYKSFGKSQDRDAFELTLRNSISNAFDMTFASRIIKIEFYELDDKEICKVDIKKSNQLIFHDSVDKSGKKTKQAFIRSGNASKALDPEEIIKYTKENF